jgi:hypothetical protein
VSSGIEDLRFFNREVTKMAKQTSKPGSKQRSRLKIGRLPTPAGKLTKAEQKKIKVGVLMDRSVKTFGDGSVKFIGDGHPTKLARSCPHPF